MLLTKTTIKIRNTCLVVSYQLQAISLMHNVHNWSLQPFSQDEDLSSHTTNVVCISFMHEWQDQCCKSEIFKWYWTTTEEVLFFLYQMVLMVKNTRMYP